MDKLSKEELKAVYTPKVKMHGAQLSPSTLQGMVDKAKKEAAEIFLNVKYDKERPVTVPLQDYINFVKSSPGKRHQFYSKKNKCLLTFSTPVYASVLEAYLGSRCQERDYRPVRDKMLLAHKEWCIHFLSKNPYLGINTLRYFLQYPPLSGYSY